MTTREIHVTLTFAVQVEGDAGADEVGQALCRRVEPPQIGCPRWIATPTAVGFIGAQDVPPAPRTTTRTTRPGGRQVPLGPAVRALAAYLTEQGFMDEQRAERTARRVMTRALPLKQRRPRTQSQIREAA